jgi:hypothetical protein
MNDMQETIFGKLDRRAAEDRARNERLMLMFMAGVYLVSGGLGFSMALPDLAAARKADPGLWGWIAVVAELTVAALMIVLAALVALGSERLRGRWFQPVTTAFWLALSVRRATLHDWSDTPANALAGLFGLLMLAWIVQLFWPVRKREGAVPN